MSLGVLSTKPIPGVSSILAIDFLRTQSDVFAASSKSFMSEKSECDQQTH